MITNSLNVRQSYFQNIFTATCVTATNKVVALSSLLVAKNTPTISYPVRISIQLLYTHNSHRRQNMTSCNLFVMFKWQLKWQPIRTAHDLVSFIHRGSITHMLFWFATCCVVLVFLPHTHCRSPRNIPFSNVNCL